MNIEKNTEAKTSGLLKFSEYVVYVFFALFPFITYKTFLYGGTSTRSANLILVVSIIGIFYAIWLLNKKNSLKLPKSWILLSLVVYFASITISALLGLNFNTSFWSAVTRTTGLWYLINLGFLIWLIFNIFFDKEKYIKLTLVIILSAALYSFLSFLSPEGVMLLFHGHSLDAFTFGNSTFAGMYIFGAFLLSIYYLFQSEVKKWWMYALPVLLVINPYILGSGLYGNPDGGLLGEARTSMIAVVFSLIYLLCIWVISLIKNLKARSRVTYSIFGVSVVFISICAYSLLTPGGFLQNIYLNQATAARPLLWEISGKVIAQRPFFGWGIDNFERVFEINYDNRLLQDEYGNEAWFDRAHNVFIDQVTDNGIVGFIFYALAYLVIILSLIYTALHSLEKNDRLLASILIVYFTLHFLELQTAFDTSISYPLLAFMIASAAILFHRTITQMKGKPYEFEVNGAGKYIIAALLIVFFVWSLFWGWLPFVRAQHANGKIRTIGDSVQRLSMYPTLFNSPVDKHAFLWRTSNDFKQALSKSPALLENPDKVANLKKEAAAFEEEYKALIVDNPEHFRAHLNLADVYMFEQLFQVNKLAEAQEVLDDAINLVPQSPQPYWMKAVTYLYMGKFDLAREYAKRAYDLNPQIIESSNVVKYIDRSIKNFPEVDFFSVKQI